MSSEDVAHSTFEGHPYTHLFTAPDSDVSVVFRVDLMQQAICSPRGLELVKAVLSGKASPDALPSGVRDLVCGAGPESPISANSPARAGIEHVQALFVVPTLDCQLRCKYCRITRQQGHQSGHRLSPQSARDAIDRVLGRVPSGTRRTLVLFGGEPLLVPDTVFAAISHAREAPEGHNTDIMLQTNGMAIDVPTARFLAEHDVFVLLSLDGVADVHDENRVLAGGGGSYARSVQGYRNAKAHGCRLGISATVTKATEDRFVSSFQAMLADLLPDACGAVTHLHPLTTGRSPFQCSPAVATAVLRETFLAARGMGIYHQQMCERIAPFVSGTWRRYACAGCGGKVVVAPDGSAGICEYNAGDGRSYVPLDEFSADTVTEFLQWAARSPLDTRECMRCAALPTCGGGCAYDSQELMGDALKFDPWLCETNVDVVRWLMRDLASHLRDRVRSHDFHVVTPEERALVIGRIPSDSVHLHVSRIGQHREAAEAGECPEPCAAG